MRTGGRTIITNGKAEAIKPAPAKAGQRDARAHSYGKALEPHLAKPDAKATKPDATGDKS